jgi:hypothetical protein
MYFTYIGVIVLSTSVGLVTHNDLAVSKISYSTLLSRLKDDQSKHAFSILIESKIEISRGHFNVNRVFHTSCIKHQ